MADDASENREPAVKRWPGALRLSFLFFAGALFWVVLIGLGWLLWRRLLMP